MNFGDLVRRLGREDGDPAPYENLAWMREISPIMRLTGPAGPDSAVWLVTSYDLARQCLSDTRLSFDPRNARIPQHAPGHTPYVLATDPPDHTALRGLVNAAYSPGAVQRLRPRIVDICERTADTLRDSRSVDLFGEYALPVTEQVAYAFFGIPADRRLPPGRATELAILIALREQYAGGPATDEMHDYLAEVVTYKSTAPGDDVVALAMSAIDDHTADRRTVLDMLYLLFATGQLSTAPFLASAVIRALEHAASAPGPAGWQPLINEVLRHDSTVQTSMPRFAVADMVIGGQEVARGDTVYVSFAGANRDPARFPDADGFRPERQARSHLGFGFGTHFCIGAPLARLETEIALDTLLRRLPHLRLAAASDELTWTLGPLLRCPREVPAENAGT